MLIGPAKASVAAVLSVVPPPEKQPEQNDAVVPVPYPPHKASDSQVGVDRHLIV